MLVKNGTAFIGGHFTRADVRVENGKIAQIGDLQPREGEEIRSAAGLYVLPGLVDIHIHAYAGADCMRGEDDVRRMSEGLLKTGVAAFMPTTMSAPIEATHRALESIQRVKDHPRLSGTCPAKRARRCSARTWKRRSSAKNTRARSWANV